MIDSAGRQGPEVNIPDPEVAEKAHRRRFSAAYKLKILHAVDDCSQPGQVGMILRREGLYSSHLSKWRRQRDEGQLKALSPNKRGRKRRPIDPDTKRLAKLERENERLRHQLRQAETIIDVQKKISLLLGISLGGETTEVS